MIVEVIRGLNMGGAETLLFSRLRYAVEYQPSGYEDTMVINTQPELDHFAAPLRALGFKVVDTRYTDPLRGAVDLRRVLSSVEPPVTVVFHSPVATYLEKARRALRLSSPDLMLDVVHSTRYRGVYSALGAALDRFADKAIAVSDDVASSSTSAHYRATEVVLAGADVARMRKWVTSSPEAPLELRSSLGLFAEQRLVVSVGSLIPLKGHQYMIRALADDRMPEVHYALIGDGPERERLRELAVSIGVQNRVSFVGRVDDGWRWTAVADAIVHPSDFEGLPVALMEAAALGTPIVGTDVGGIRQILDGGAHGLLLPERSPTTIAATVMSALQGTAPISTCFPERGAAGSYWSMERYAEDFYSALHR